MEKKEKFDDGEKLKLIRKELGLNQDDLAKLFNVQQANISKLERGIYAVSRDYVNKLFKKHNVNPDWWYHNRGTMFKVKIDPKKTSTLHDLQFMKNQLELAQLEIEDLQEKLSFMNKTLGQVQEDLRKLKHERVTVH